MALESDAKPSQATKTHIACLVVTAVGRIGHQHLQLGANNTKTPRLVVAGKLLALDVLVEVPPSMDDLLEAKGL